MYHIQHDSQSFTPEYLELPTGLTDFCRYNGKEFYVQTPEFTVINYRESATMTELFVKFNHCDDFLQLLDTIDSLMIQANNRSVLSLTEFISTRLLNVVSAQRNIVRLVIPVIDSKEKVNVYDETGTAVPFKMIDVGFRGRALLQPDQIRGHRQLWCGWNVIQIKIKIPEIDFNGCLLRNEAQKNSMLDLNFDEQ